MKTETKYAHLFTGRYGQSFGLMIVDRSDIETEYETTAANRNDALDPETATIEGMIEWLETKADDGAVRRYVPLADALRDGIRASGYGRSEARDANDVAWTVEEPALESCEECGCDGFRCDTTDGEIVRDGKAVCYVPADFTRLMTDAQGKGRLVCEECAEVLA